MKIDIHVHTRKIKTGDALSRNIEAEKFIETMKNTDVKIMAITNHNHFDITQYEVFREGVKDHCQLWPGVELDVFENDKRGHLIVICNPINHEEFDKRVKALIGEKNVDTFTCSIKEMVESFDDLDCIYVAHYFAKKPNIGDEELELLGNQISNKKRIIKEATNSISAGIYISHGHNSIYGSDVHDWDNYIKESENLPELRLPVESFEQFSLLLEKDEATINTLLNSKTKENVELVPFTVADKISLEIFNDINILFGSKGTGKTEILDNLSKYYNDLGYKTNVYKSNDQHLSEAFNLRGSDNIDFATLNIDGCEEEIQFIKQVSEEDITSISKYKQHFALEQTNKISKNLKIKDTILQDDTVMSRKLSELNAISQKFNDFLTYTRDNDDLKDYINLELLEELIAILNKILFSLKKHTEDKFIEKTSVKMLNQIINLFSTEIAKKTGQPQKPAKTGFAEYASNRIKIEKTVKKILQNISKQIEPIEEYAGSLGEKGEIFCKTNLKIQDGNITDSAYSPVKQVRKTPQKDFAKSIIAIQRSLYNNNLFEKITELNAIDGIETINSVNDLLLKYKHFILNNESYSPSNGESSMILLHKELSEDKEIYLIDEPEKSLGNDYINDVIVPLLREKALLGKKVIIATHDANIAVRTLPYNSIYRLHDKGQYYTLTGNPFSNKLKCIYGIHDELDWKEISMKTLEGGKEAFGERGKIYGN